MHQEPKERNLIMRTPHEVTLTSPNCKTPHTSVGTDLQLATSAAAKEYLENFCCLLMTKAPRTGEKKAVRSNSATPGIGLVGV